MKTKMVFIFIAVVGIISACDVSDSNNTQEEYNPQVDGLWAFQTIVSIRCDNEPTICEQYHDIYYVSIDYPFIDACYERLEETEVHKLTEATKQDVEVTHKKENFYGIKTLNGDTVSSDTLTFEMKTDEFGHLSILKMLPDGELEGLNYRSANGTGLPGTTDYQKCRENATYTEELIPDEL